MRFLDRGANVAALDLAAGHELLRDRGSDIGRNVESDADRSARRRENGRIDADHTAECIERRPAGVTPIDRRIDLDVVHEIFPDIPIIGRDNAGRRRVAEAERVAHGENPVADPGFSRVLEIDERIAMALDLDDGEIGAFIAPDHDALELLAILQNDLDVVGIFDNVVVSDDVAVSRNEEAGAGGHLFGRLGLVALGILALAARDNVEGKARDPSGRGRVDLGCHIDRYHRR